MALKLRDRTVEFLQSEPDKKFTAREIAEWILKTYPEECEEKRLRSTARITPLEDTNALLTQLVAEIGSNRPAMQIKHPHLKTTEGRPRKYYWSLQSDEDEVVKSEAAPEADELAKSFNPSYTEHDLHPVLTQFVRSELHVYGKRIDERKSSNSRGRGGNHWLYPDLVGMEDLSDTWHSEIKEIVKQYADHKTKLWAFEVKKLVNLSNVREVFFQAVSNSSWANFGYLVAAEFVGEKTSQELRMLSSLHGIGVIRLDVENPTESQILIPALEKPNVDWDTANRIAQENKDFRDFIKLVRQFYQTGDVREKDWGIKRFSYGAKSPFHITNSIQKGGVPMSAFITI